MPYTDEGIGYQKTDTSQAGAIAMSIKAGTIKAEIIACLKAFGKPMTSPEIAAIINRTPQTTRCRMSELKMMDQVIDTELRRTGPSGVVQICWALKGFQK